MKPKDTKCNDSKFPQLQHIFTDSYHSFKQSLDISDPALMNVNMINILPPSRWACV